MEDGEFGGEEKNMLEEISQGLERGVGTECL